MLDVVEALRHVRAREAAGNYAGVIKIKILRNYSAELIDPFVKYYFGQMGLRCDFSVGGFDTIHQDLFDADDLRTYDLIVVSLTFEGLDRSGKASAAELLQHITAIADLVLEKSPASLILNTFIRPVVDYGGAVHALGSNSLTTCIVDLNQKLRTYVAKNSPRCLLIDWERLIMLIGVDMALDRRMGYVAAAPFGLSFLSAYSYEIFRIGRALKGAGKKCLILDCDDTLWGGVIGEAGLEGIDLDPVNYPGKAFYDFQKAIVRLVDQGIMVALCSKNNLNDVMEVLDSHPHCILKRKHLVSYRINWEDKERNIEAMIEELNIGMDSILVVDDSPIELERIKTFLPEITVRVVPQRLYDLPLLLDREGFFDKIATTEEDLNRAKLYQTETRRREVAAQFASVDDFLASLEIKARIEPPNASRVPRVSQLTQKTNQFNLTTRRYSEGDISTMVESPDHAVFTLTASDRFGDLGLTGLFIARLNGQVASIDTLLMSCRVLGRKLEQEFVVYCIEALDKRWQPRRWIAEYVETRKNGQVANFWPIFGFMEETRENGRIRYSADRTSLKIGHVSYITVEMP